MVQRICMLFFWLAAGAALHAQVPVNTGGFTNKGGATVATLPNSMVVSWPAGAGSTGRIAINLEKDAPLFNSLQLVTGKQVSNLLRNADAAFLLTVGKRDLVSQNGWNIFFDKVPLKPHQSYPVTLEKQSAEVTSMGNRTIIRVGNLKAPGFTGVLEITLYKGSPLVNVAAVVTTAADSVAIVYDAGFISKEKNWNRISWAAVNDSMQTHSLALTDSSKTAAVKYRTIIGSNAGGSLAVFPAPHQYFYPLDEAFNLRVTWYGNQYHQLFDGYGMGIRQDLYGDNRYVPWFNAPPGTAQRLNFFCLMGEGSPASLLERVKAFTHKDAYIPLPGYQTMASHFHNEHVMKTVLAGKPVPATPNFVKVFEATGVNIVHLGEFHYTAHPKGPDEQRLKELQTLFSECRRLSSKRFLLLPGEEPNEFLGGHWLQFFPRPVYWIMARKNDQPFETTDPVYGKVYRVSNAAEMLDLLQKEKGLAWTAHARTKGSTGFPDKYKTEKFFLSDRFLGAAWKAMPADLSQPRLGKRVLDLMDDMNNWGLKKKVIAEADLFTIEPENEMYAHLNVNYLQLQRLPSFSSGWQPVMDVLEKGKFFSTTGEVLIPAFTVNGKGSGETASLTAAGNASVSFDLQWTFPLHFAEIISGDGVQVYRQKIDLSNTVAFGKRQFRQQVNLEGRKWVRLEVWDVAANGAFTQTVWLQ